ncbi:hypothetical protein BDR03DRAFT_319330 [Suillus americanus]|nr:hypothetical protein BDR03DRAFT_319330 [Suillus americanus]
MSIEFSDGIMSVTLCQLFSPPGSPAGFIGATIVRMLLVSFRKLCELWTQYTHGLKFFDLCGLLLHMHVVGHPQSVSRYEVLRDSIPSFQRKWDGEQRSLMNIYSMTHFHDTLMSEPMVMDTI